MMLESVGVDDSGLPARLVALYGHELNRSLRCFDGVPSLLSEIRSLGISLCVITEGPRDAQEETIARLGLADLFDLLVTSNDAGVTKTDGLFAVALERMGCAPSQVLFVGDSVERDLRPTQALGIESYLIDHRGLHKDLTIPRLDSLCGLLDLLRAPQKA